MTPVRTLYGDDFCVIEHRTTGRFPHCFLGAPGSDQSVVFRMLHVFEFRGGAISREENVWLDAGPGAARARPTWPGWSTTMTPGPSTPNGPHGRPLLPDHRA